MSLYNKSKKSLGFSKRNKGEKMKRLLLGLGTVATVTLPVAGVVACGSKSDASTAKQQAPQTQAVARSTKPTVNVEATYEGKFDAAATRITLSNVQITDLVANVLKASVVFMEKGQQADYLTKVADLKTLAPAYVKFVEKIMAKPMDGTFVNDLASVFSTSNVDNITDDISVIFDLVTAVLRGNNVGGFVTIIKNELAKVFTNEAQFNEIINSKMFGVINSPIVQGMLPTITSIISPLMGDIKELFSSLLHLIQPIATDKTLITILSGMLLNGMPSNVIRFATGLLMDDKEGFWQLIGKAITLVFAFKDDSVLPTNKLKKFASDIFKLNSSAKPSTDLRNSLIQPIKNVSEISTINTTLLLLVGISQIPTEHLNTMWESMTKAEWNTLFDAKIASYTADRAKFDAELKAYTDAKAIFDALPANQAKQYTATPEPAKDAANGAWRTWHNASYNFGRLLENRAKKYDDSTNAIVRPADAPITVAKLQAFKKGANHYFDAKATAKFDEDISVGVGAEDQVDGNVKALMTLLSSTQLTDFNTRSATVHAKLSTDIINNLVIGVHDGVAALKNTALKAQINKLTEKWLADVKTHGDGSREQMVPLFDSILQPILDVLGVKAGAFVTNPGDALPLSFALDGPVVSTATNILNIYGH